MKTIGIIALSGAIDKEKLNFATDNLKKLGFNIKLSKNIFDTNRYLAGNDKDKVEELEKFFLDPKIDIIMTARGGYGAIRLIDKIDYNILKNHPKIFTGFSDVTALLLMIYKKTGMVTYHGLMATPDFGFDCEIDEFSFRQFQAAINGEELNFEGNKIYRDGTAEGIIWGGNLATLVSLCGTDFIPNEDFIFFAEDLNEPVYKIDKMFTQLFNIKEFKKYCKGIVLGDFLDCGNEKWLEEFFVELSGIHQIPIVGGFKITHNRKKITIPIGKNVILSGVNLKILK